MSSKAANTAHPRTISLPPFVGIPNKSKGYDMKTLAYSLLLIFITLFLFLSHAAEEGSIPDYDRDDWPHWEDFDRDCQHTRQELLIGLN